jgi:flagellar motor switch protein FliN/FliY
VEVSVELGRSVLTLDHALDLGKQSVMELNRMLGDPVDIRLNGRLFARGEVVTVNEHFGVRLTELVAEAG